MASKFVRSSKFRHVFGTPAKPENSYLGTKLANTAWDSNFMACNTKFFAMMWLSAGGGVYAVIPYDMAGKLGDMPVVTVHKGAVLDLDCHPFNDSLVASASEDCNVCICAIPEGGLKDNISSATQVLSGHKRKAGTVNFHPCANNILASSASDTTVKIWDIEKGDELFSIGGHSDIVQSCSWNINGSLLASACRDKKLRIIDPRAQTTVAEQVVHQGIKGMRCNWLTDRDKIFTVGFTKTSEREFCIWDPKSLAEPLARQILDSQSGVIMPFYDSETSTLFLAGKGDGNVRYYEIVDEKPYFYFLSEYKSSNPQRGMAMLPKRAVNVSACEILRLFKIESNKVEPISFTVPRKSDLFQDDLYPNCYSGTPVLSAEEWKSGQNKDPDFSFSHAPGFVAPAKPAQDFNPVVKEVEKPKTERELKEDNDALKNRVSYLEAELAKKEAIIKDLQSQLPH
jgi:WD40 repeat protein